MGQHNINVNANYIKVLAGVPTSRRKLYYCLWFIFTMLWVFRLNSIKKFCSAICSCRLVVQNIPAVEGNMFLARTIRIKKLYPQQHSGYIHKSSLVLLHARMCLREVLKGFKDMPFLKCCLNAIWLLVMSICP